MLLLKSVNTLLYGDRVLQMSAVSKMIQPPFDIKWSGDIGCHHHHHHHQYHHQHHHHLQLPIMDGAPTLALTLAAIAFALA